MTDNKFYKYPRTYHFPWSLGSTSDDKFLENVDSFLNMDIVVTLKMDGENCSMYNNHNHARSINSGSHVSRNWVKRFWNTIKNDIPDGYRICGENLYAKHSIYYNDLKSYFYGFSIWNKETCLSWKETIEWFKLLSINPVEVIYEGKFDIDKLIVLAENLNHNENEGYVVRNRESFEYKDFSKNVGKFVRKGHVQTDTHWMSMEVIPNKVVFN